MSSLQSETRHHSKGFTLLELLVVMAIMILLMGMGLTGYYGIRRGAEMRGAISSVRTTLMLARQQAVTKRRTVTVQFVTSSTTNLMRILETTLDGSNIPAHADAYLPAGVQFSGLPDPVVFYPSGRAIGTSSSDVTVQEKVAQRDGIKESRTIRVWALTGITKEL
jgi:prepilin-type N-terminal cleavage/methylation domain-containing protein